MDPQPFLIPFVCFSGQRKQTKVGYGHRLIHVTETSGFIKAAGGQTSDDGHVNIFFYVTKTLLITEADWGCEGRKPKQDAWLPVRK